MKKIYIILALVPLLLASCTRDPYADFRADKRVVLVGEEITFTNRSVDAYDYEWDFGDGYIAYTFHAVKSWSEAGIYQVALTAFGKDGRRDVAVMEIEVLPVADLLVVVEEYFEPYYLVEDARVRLYPTVRDWEDETNLVVQGYTNSNGEVIFTDLMANTRYYVDVFGPFHDNYQLAAEDAGWIETQVLVPDALNEFVAVVDYYPEGKKKSAEETKSLKQQKRDSVDPSKARKYLKREKK